MGGAWVCALGKWAESLIAMSTSTELEPEGEGASQQPGTSANPFSFKSFLSKRASGGEDGATGRKGIRKKNQGGGTKAKKESVPEENLPFPELEDTGRLGRVMFQWKISYACTRHES